MLLKVKFLGHEKRYKTIKPIHSKITAIHRIPSPTGKVALMSFIGALNFYTKFIEKLHFNLKPFYDFLHENTPWKWTEDHVRLFQTLKTSLTSDTGTYNSLYKTSLLYYCRCFPYWIRRCPFSTE